MPIKRREQKTTARGMFHVKQNGFCLANVSHAHMPAEVNLSYHRRRRDHDMRKYACVGETYGVSQRLLVARFYVTMFHVKHDSQ